MKLKNDPDYVPSVFVHSTDKTKASSAGKVSRCKRLMKRRERKYAAKQQQRCTTERKQKMANKKSKVLMTEQTDHLMVVNSKPEEETVSYTEPVIHTNRNSSCERNSELL